MSKQIVILTGSKRKKGNTEKLVDAFSTGAKSTGKSVTIFQTANMSINGCTGCEYCLQHPGKCALSDDMGKVLEALYKADVIVWASPVYYFSVTAQLKSAIDRTYPLQNDNVKKTVLLLTCADEDYDTAAGAIAIYERIVKYYKWDDKGIIIANEVEHLGDIDGHDALAKAEKLGQEI